MSPRSVTRLLSVSCMALWLSACPNAKRTPAGHSTAAPESPDTRAERLALTPKVTALSQEAQALLRAQDTLVWKNWTEGASGDLAKTYEGHDALLSPEAIQQVNRLRALSTDPRDIRALTFLKNYLVGEYLARQTGELSEAIANLEASMSFSAEGRDQPYRDLERLLAAEKSERGRRALYTAATSSVVRLGTSVQRKDEKLEDLLEPLGYASWEAFGAELRQADFTALSAVAEQVLTLTQKPFERALQKLAETELVMPVERVDRSDFPRLFRPRGVDPFFPKDQLLSRAQETMKGLGFDWSALKNLRIDARESAQKSARPLTLPIEVPGDVRVSVKLNGGIRHQRMLFHELGHALHDALTTEKRFELAKLGNGTPAEVFAYAFEELTEDPEWLAQHAGLTGTKQSEYLAASAAQKLFLLRRAAGRLLYQVEVERLPEGEDGKAIYARIMKRAYAVPQSSDDIARWVLDQEDFYPAADTLRAWLLAGQLLNQLEHRFGKTWWKRTDAGDFLRTLFAPGNGWVADELAQHMGEPGVSAAPLVMRLVERLPNP